VAAHKLAARAGESARALGRGARGALSLSVGAAARTHASLRFVGRHAVAPLARAVGEGSGRFKLMVDRSRELHERARERQRGARPLTLAGKVSDALVQAGGGAAPAEPGADAADAADAQPPTARAQAPGAPRPTSMAGGLASRIYRSRN
jgi:hypothetical protein